MSDQLTLNIMADEIDIFLEDVNKYLHEMETSILCLEEKSDADTLNAAFRAAHTLKALAGMVGHRPMAELTHTIETLFDAMRDNRFSPTQVIVDDLLTAVDTLKTLRDGINDQKIDKVDVSPLIARLQAIVDDNKHLQTPNTARTEMPQLTPQQSAHLQTLLETGQPLLQISIRTAPEAFAPAARLYQASIVLSELGEPVVHQPALDALNEEDTTLWLILATSAAPADIEKQLAAVSDLGEYAIQPFCPENLISAPGKISITNPNNDRFIKHQYHQLVRISVEQLDTLMNLVGELVTYRTRLLQIEDMIKVQTSNGVVDALSDMLPQFSYVVDKLQEEVMHARMEPISTLFDKFPRLVRDVARLTNKQVDLVIEGEATELDRAVIEAVGDPLVHLIRNAIDHGLEAPAAREAAGKPANGTIRVTAVSAEGHITITVSDDGQGINPDRVRETAVDKHILSAEEAHQIADSEMIDLVFLPNLTTATEVTEMSGRGIGLDIVRSNIQRLGGSVIVTSETGVGTTFHITLPLTLALVQTMLVTVHNTFFAIPVMSISAVLYMADAHCRTVKGKSVIDWAEEVVPLLDLRHIFKNPRLSTGTFTSDKPRIVIVTWGKLRVGLIVDKIIGQQEIVVKSLSPLVGSVDYISGATILGDGCIALILDIPGLFNTTLSRKQRELTKVSSYV